MTGKHAIVLPAELAKAVEAVYMRRADKKTLEDDQFIFKVYRVDQYTPVRIDIKKVKG